MAIDIPINRIASNPWQTRQAYDPDSIASLAGDIQRNGLLQPPVGRIVDADGKPQQVDDFCLGSAVAFQTYLDEHAGHWVQLAFGHNRLRAFKYLHASFLARPWNAMPVVPRRLTDEEMATLAWAENEQRKDLNAVEEALAIRRRIDDFGWTQEEVAKRLGLARSTVSNKLRLLDLPGEVLEHLSAGAISERQAMAILPAYTLTGEELALIAWAQEQDGVAVDGPNHLFAWALENEWSSGRIRDEVEQLKGTIAKYAEWKRRLASARSRTASQEEANGFAPADEGAAWPDAAPGCRQGRDVREIDTDSGRSASLPGAAQAATSDWPQPRFDSVFERLKGMTKAQLEQLHERFAQEQWNQYRPEWRGSDLKPTQFAHVRDQLQFHANLEAVQLLTPGQTVQFYDWMRSETDGKYFWGRQNGWLRPTDSILGSVRSVEGLGIMASEAFARFRTSETRRAGAFCYHLFLQRLQLRLEEASPAAEERLVRPSRAVAAT